MITQKSTTHIWIAALICAVYVALGAFGAHGLVGKITDSQLGTFNTGLRYLIIHALGLMVINSIFILKSEYSKWVNVFIYLGMLLFSFSLVIHGTKDLLGIEHNVFAMLAPVGGLCYIISWVLFARIISKG